MKDHIETATKGFLGMLATGSGFYVSFLPQVEAWLRILSLAIGITVGVVSLISIIARHRSKKRGDNE